MAWAPTTRTTCARLAGASDLLSEVTDGDVLNLAELDCVEATESYSEDIGRRKSDRRTEVARVS
jgi:hypothetical protein